MSKHDLVRVRETRPDGSVVEYSIGAARAMTLDLILLDESPYTRNGDVKPETRKDGRPVKPKTSVSVEAAKKAAKSADRSDNAPSKENAHASAAA